jgi:high-affinity nickel-transport protein
MNLANDHPPGTAPGAAFLAGLRGRVAALYALLIGVNAGAWIWALAAFHHYPVLLGAALLAYTLGLRHAVDADHIAAIDNVTRKLMQQGQRPVSVGFCFSLGHSTIVFGLSVVIALASVAIKNHFDDLAFFGGIIGTTVSAIFLLAIGFANLLVLISLGRTFQRVRRGGRFDDEDLDLLLAQRGFFGRIFRNLFGLITRGWQMYLVGLLFGLGFDTATEVGLLGISAREAAQGLPVWTILVFPTLFTAGMALVDTTDSILMLGAYGWAFVKPVRKLYYNLTITLVSVLVAFLIGGIEALGLIGDQFKIHGAVWDQIGLLNKNLGMVGLAIIGVFVLSWGVSILIYRRNRFDEIQVNLAPGLRPAEVAVPSRRPVRRR